MLVALLTALVLLTSTAYFALVLCSPSPPQGSPSEDTYRTSTVPQPQPLRTVHQPATLGLSVVVPAYNEKHRLGHMLRAAVDYLESVPVQSSSGSKVDVVRGSYEVIIVDDGSKDGTAQVALDLAKELQEKWERVEGKKRQMRGEIKVVTLVRNRGKGGSVKHGMLHASGERVLFVDADGASHFPDLALLQKEMDTLESAQLKAGVEHEAVQGLVVGSRAHLVGTAVVVKRSFSRNLLMRLFHTYLFILGIRSIRDTQCGFKLSTRATTAHLYPSMHSPSWIFDCELLLLAELSHITIKEVGIEWKEVEGSKVDLIRDSLGMAVDLLVIRGNYWMGRWTRPGLVTRP